MAKPSELNNNDFLHHEACPVCPSSDAFAVYSDGAGHCFRCEYHRFPDDTIPERSVNKISHIKGDLIPQKPYDSIPDRRIWQETCAKFDYFFDPIQKVWVAPYRDSEGNIVAQKLRAKGKQFSSRGDMKSASLFGQHLWKTGGRRVVITEGELDCLAVSQIQQNKYPVVSVPTGSKGAKKALGKQLEWLETFDEVVLCFDQDEAGQEAALECATLFSPGKARLTKLPDKLDASDLVREGREKELTEAIWNAVIYRPDGIISASDLWEDILTSPDVECIDTPWAGLNNITRGIRKREIFTLCAGSGVGKSQVCRELAYDLIHSKKMRVGYIALEESVKKTALSLMGLHLNKRLELTKNETTEEELREAFEALTLDDRLYLYDHFGSLESDNLLYKLRYLAVGLECDFIVLDHLSIVVSGLIEGDERRIIDNLMTNIRSLVEDTGVGMILVSHLRSADGTPHEEGGRTSLSQLRGSRAIGQLSDIAVGLERNQQDKEYPDRTTVRVLKNRFEGSTGQACMLDYERTTGRLKEVTGFETPNNERNGGIEY